MWQRMAGGLILVMAALIFSCAPQPYHATPPPKEGTIELIVRVDDVGLLHATNAAALALMEESIATDFSVVVNTGWFPEIARGLAARNDVSLGVQLTLTSPWRHFRWGPVSTHPAVQLLRGPDGFFPPVFATLQNHGSDSLAVITEFRAQIERARQAGMTLTYLHFPQPREAFPTWMTPILETLAREFRLGITGYFDARPTPPISGATAEAVEAALIDVLNGLTPGRWVLAAPAGDNSPEMRAAGLPDRAGAVHRQHLMRALRSSVVAALCVERGIQLLSYRDLLHRSGLLEKQMTQK